tara:strand:+ start:19919 stop:20245 length:327 start_codon:yes stop_codon:yes gene_type:complete
MVRLTVYFVTVIILINLVLHFDAAASTRTQVDCAVTKTTKKEVTAFVGLLAEDRLDARGVYNFLMSKLVSCGFIPMETTPEQFKAISYYYGQEIIKRFRDRIKIKIKN